jgi:hypothetical protein
MCRTGCRTQDHESWGECARDARFYDAGVAKRDEYKAYDKELTDYESARRQGIQPETTRRKDIDSAIRKANR